LSQFPPGAGPLRRAFPARNAVIAALAKAVVVVEASSASGSLHTAEAARRLGRRVIAVAGSFGADTLIARGAALAARTVDDVIAHLEGRAVAVPPPPSDPEAARLYAALDKTPRDLGDLAARVGLSITRCAALAAMLELGGFAARATGGRYARTAVG
jgi:DNA processing protein